MKNVKAITQQIRSNPNKSLVYKKHARIRDLKRKRLKNKSMKKWSKKLKTT